MGEGQKYARKCVSLIRIIKQNILDGIAVLIEQKKVLVYINDQIINMKEITDIE